MGPKAIEALRRGNYAPATKVRAAILQLCAAEPQTKAQIARAVGRSPRTTEAYLRDLLREGTLQRIGPVTSPNASYRTVPEAPE